MAKRKPRRPAPAAGPGLHEYAEHAAEWVLHYKFTLIVAAAVVVGVAVLAGSRRRGARTSEVQVWEKLTTLGRRGQDLEGLRADLSELEGTSAYPWAALKVAARFYYRGRFQEARAILEPVAENPEVAPYPRGYSLYLLGCLYIETDQPTQARKSLEKALTVNGESPFLQELVRAQLEALRDWPPEGQPGPGAAARPAEAASEAQATSPSPPPGDDQ